MAHRDTSVSALCRELGITPTRNVTGPYMLLVRTSDATPPGPRSQGAPDLMVYGVSVATNPSGTPPGGSFTLSAGVRNDGDAASAATTLRYYRSTDATITTTDTSVGTDAVGGLAAATTSSESIDLTAPSAPGTYYYGACVDAVTGESDTTNNCSSAVSVTVSAPPPTLHTSKRCSGRVTPWLSSRCRGGDPPPVVQEIQRVEELARGTRGPTRWPGGVTGWLPRRPAVRRRSRRRR